MPFRACFPPYGAWIRILGVKKLRQDDLREDGCHRIKSKGASKQANRQVNVVQPRFPETQVNSFLRILVPHESRRDFRSKEDVAAVETGVRNRAAALLFVPIHHRGVDLGKTEQPALGQQEQ